ncbi:hypothetical protein F5X97DRAFT_327569 [Nemania serpens]|nr:hypothetical protein F5X97DRAFT_327569 [Nemania serpens]
MDYRYTVQWVGGMVMSQMTAKKDRDKCSAAALTCRYVSMALVRLLSCRIRRAPALLSRVANPRLYAHCSVLRAGQAENVVVSYCVPIIPPFSLLLGVTAQPQPDDP